MARPQGPLGWIYNRPSIEAHTEACAKAGRPVVLGDSRPDLKGYFRRLVAQGVKGVFLQQDESSVLGGRHLDAYQQRRGICVELGTGRALQDTWFNSLARKGMVGKSVLLATEPIYGGGRVQIGRGGLRGGDGLYVHWAAEYLRQYGICERAVYGSYDLSRANEPLSVDWGDRGLPREVLDACAPHPVVPYRAMSVEDIADCISAGFGVSGGTNTIWSGTRDRNGMCRPESSGGHCQELNAWFLLNGELCLGHQQSWTNAVPGGPNVTRYDGGEITWRPGAYGIYGDDYAHALTEGEAFSLEIKQDSGWRPASVAEMA